MTNKDPLCVQDRELHSISCSNQSRKRIWERIHIWTAFLKTPQHTLTPVLGHRHINTGNTLESLTPRTHRLSSLITTCRAREPESQRGQVARAGRSHSPHIWHPLPPWAPHVNVSVHKQGWPLELAECDSRQTPQQFRACSAHKGTWTPTTALGTALLRLPVTDQHHTASRELSGSDV